MIIIAADIGNSATKILVGEGDHSICSSRQAIVLDLHSIGNELPGEAAFWVLCSVQSRHCEALRNWIVANRPKDIVHEIQATEIPLESRVVSRKATGRDRLVAAHAAAKLTPPDCATIVVDAGTAVTIDLIDSSRVFQGGVIFPGAATSLGSLSAAISALPDLSKDLRDCDLESVMSTVIGADTRLAMLRGVYHSQLAAMKEIVRSIATRQPQPCDVFATGGGIERLRKFLPSGWRIVPDLVLQGAFDIGRQLANPKMAADQ